MSTSTTGQARAEARTAQATAQAAQSHQAVFGDCDPRQLLDAINNSANAAAAPPPQATPLQQEIQDAEARAVANNGIPGYDGERTLTVEERAFHTQMKSVGFTHENVDELFRHGVSSNEVLKGMSLKYDHIIDFLSNMSANPSRLCPDTTKVFFSPVVLAVDLQIVQKWIQFRASIGASISSTEWNNPAVDHYDQTRHRIKCWKGKEDPVFTASIGQPAKLLDMRKFIYFEEHFCLYLRSMRGRAGAPLTYVIREESVVTDEDRNGIVGPQGTYTNWDGYMVRCTPHSGRQYEADNDKLYRILFPLIRDGPGYDCIRGISTNGRRDGRKAYLTLKQKAYSSAIVRPLIQQSRLFYATSRYHGVSKSGCFDNFCRAWYRNNYLLDRFGQRPDESDLVLDFCQAIRDPLLDIAKDMVIIDTKFSTSFDETVLFFKRVLGQAEYKKKKDQAILACVNSIGNTGSGNSSKKKRKKKRNEVDHFDGVVRNVWYTQRIFRNFTPAQKAEHKRIRQEGQEARQASKRHKSSY